MFKKLNIVPRWIIFLIDLSICCFAFTFSSLIKHNLALDVLNWRDLSGNLLIIVLINSIVFINFRTYAGIIRYTGVQDALRICYAIAMSTSVLYFISLVASNSGSVLFFSNVTLIIYALFTFLFLISYRVLVKYAFAYLRSYKMDRKHVIIYGAGEAGFATKRVLEHDTTSNINIVAFVDDDLRKVGKVVDGIKIQHTLDLQAIALTQKIDEIIIAAFTLLPAKKNELVDFCLDHDITVLNVPPVDKWINGQFSARQLQTIKIENLLEREPIRINNEELVNQLQNKRILVTGAAGSIGSEIVRQLLKFNPQTIIICDQAETPLHQLELELQDIKTGTNCISFLGDVTNRHRMEELFNPFDPFGLVSYSKAIEITPFSTRIVRATIATAIIIFRIIISSGQVLIFPE